MHKAAQQQQPAQAAWGAPQQQAVAGSLVVDVRSGPNVDALVGHGHGHANGHANAHAHGQAREHAHARTQGHAHGHAQQVHQHFGRDADLHSVMVCQG